MLPSLFVSHGSPMLALTPSSARDFLAGLGRDAAAAHGDRHRSAHWETERPAVNGVAVNPTIHDFYGFPPRCMRCAIRAGLGGGCGRVASLLDAAGPVRTRPGARAGPWRLGAAAADVPAHDIPVVQLSVQTSQGPRHDLRLGEALAPLRREGVLVIGSGAFTHDLRACAERQLRTSSRATKPMPGAMIVAVRVAPDAALEGRRP